MTPERWKQVEAVFEQALAVPAAERAAFFAQTCKGDEELRREVESLLESHGEAGDFIDRRSLFFSSEELEETAAPLQSGQAIGPYRVLREIGRGGMGAVYLAERADEQYQKQVAIKLIKRGMDTESVLRHFRNERQILASFDHPNIARLFDGGTTEDGLPYFVMEYVEGIPIDRYCAAHELSIAERLKLFREVCAAVSYAHRHAVIHRDIKPSNILVTSEGTPKLLDFGIAKILQPGDGPEALMTATGARAMTPEYASPEQIGGEPVTTASDVYSLGVVLYELVTGRLPYRFASQSPVDVSRTITEQAPERPSTAASSANRQSKIESRKFLRGDLDNIVLMALRKEPSRRYQSVEQFSDDIRRHLESLPVRARKDTLGYRAGKFVRRNPTLTTAAALLLLSLLGGIIATSWQAHRARVQEVAAKAEKARAERRFNDVRKLANTVLFDYYDAIKDLAGATPVRERLVRDALAYLDSLAGEAAGDPALQRELAAAYERVGDVRGEQYGASLGDTAGAIDSYLKALRIREALAVSAPRDIPSRRDLAASYRKLGNAFLGTREAARGWEQLNKALALYSELAAEQPGNPDARRELAQIHTNVGFALEEKGDLTGTLEHHRKARAINEEALAANPSDRRSRRAVSVSYENIGRALYLSGDPAGALENNRRALALREALRAEDPTNAEYRRILGISYQNDGDYRAFLRDVDGALDSFRKKLALDEESLASDPGNAQCWGDLGYSCQRIGDLLAAKGDYSEALSYHRKAVEMRQKLLARAPQNLDTRYWLIIDNASVAKMQAKLGQRTAALAECDKAITLLKETPDDRTHAVRSSFRAQAYTHLAEAYAALAASTQISGEEAREHWRAVREMFRQSLDIWQDQRERGILSGEDAAKPQETAAEIAKCDAALAKQGG